MPRFKMMRIMPRTQEQVNDPQFMFEMAWERLQKLNDNGEPDTTAQERKEFLMAMGRVNRNDPEQVNAVIAEFMNILPTFAPVDPKEKAERTMSKKEKAKQKARERAKEYREKKKKVEAMAKGER